VTLSHNTWDAEVRITFLNNRNRRVDSRISIISVGKGIWDDGITELMLF